MPLHPAKGFGLDATDVGFRVVVRHELPSGKATDVLGELVSVQAGELVVRPANGQEIRIGIGSIRAAKRVPPGPARLRPARPADAKGIETLRVRCWSTAYRGMIPDAFLDAMLSGLPDGVARRRLLLAAPSPEVHQLVAEAGAGAGAGVVGWAGGGPSRDADRNANQTGEIYACYVAPEWAGFGIGGRLLRRVLAGLAADGRHSVTLWVLAANGRARRFYAAHGFAPDGEQQTLDLGGPVIEVRYVRAPGPAPVSGSRVLG